MFESLTEYVSGSPWTYLFLFVVAALDAIIPLVPSETSVILAGVLASTGDLNLVLVILFAAAGASPATTSRTGSAARSATASSTASSRESGANRWTGRTARWRSAAAT